MAAAEDDRAMARKCRRLAGAVTDEATLKALHSLAEEYDRLADEEDGKPSASIGRPGR